MELPKFVVISSTFSYLHDTTPQVVRIFIPTEINQYIDNCNIYFLKGNNLNDPIITYINYDITADYYRNLIDGKYITYIEIYNFTVNMINNIISNKLNVLISNEEFKYLIDYLKSEKQINDSKH